MANNEFSVLGSRLQKFTSGKMVDRSNDE